MLSIFKKFFFGSNDLTEGNLLVKMLGYALPVILASIASLLFTTVDLMMINYLGSGELAMSGIGACTSVIGLIIGAVNSFSLGAAVIVGNYVGAKDKEGTKRAITTSIILATSIGAIALLVVLFVCPSILSLSNIADAIYPYAETYIKAYAIGVPFVVIYAFASAIVRAFGDSKTPLFILLLSGVLNVFLNYLFVGVFNLDVFGVGFATALSQLFSCILIFFYLFKSKKSYVNIHLKEFKFFRKDCIDLIRFGVASSIQTLIFALSNFIIQKVVTDCKNSILI